MNNRKNRGLSFGFLFGLLSLSGTSWAMENPKAVPDTITAVVGQPVHISVRNILSNDTDIDSDRLFVATVANWQNGVAVWRKEQGVITFTPTDNNVSSAQFTYGVSDLSSNSREWNRMDWADVTILFSQPDTVTHDDPISSNDVLVVDFGAPIIISASDLLANDYDPNGDVLTVNYIDDPVGGTFSSIDTDRGAFEFLPTPGLNQASFTYGVSDRADTHDPEHMGYGTVTLNNNAIVVTEEGAKPVAVADQIIATSGLSIDIEASRLLANDTDEDSSQLYVATVSNWDNGEAKWNRDSGIITFTPADESVTTAQFTYGVSDTSSTSKDWKRMDWARVTISFNEQISEPIENGENPKANADVISATVGQPIEILESALLINDVDVDSEQLFIATVSDEEGGTFEWVKSSGVITFTPTDNSVTFAEFTYGVSDVSNDSKDWNRMDWAKVTINFTQSTGGSNNIIPVASDDVINGLAGETLVISPAQLTANDVDSDSNQLYIPSVSQAVGGSVNINDDGTISFTPSSSDITFGEFQYLVSDLANDTGLNRTNNVSATVSLHLSPTTISVERASNLTCLAPEPIIEPDSIRWAPAFPSLPTLPALTLNQGTAQEQQIPRTMIAMLQPKNDSDFWLLATVSGQVYKFDNHPQASQTELVFDLSDKLRLLGEMGLLGLAIHPNYPADNRVFLFFNDNPTNDEWGGRSVIASYEMDINTQQIDRNSEVEILTVQQFGRNHKGGDLAFDSEGLLYATLGDDDRGMPAQHANTLKGKVIRINIDSVPYQIPESNPYYVEGGALCSAGTGTNQGVTHCPEIFASGLRNPWRFSIDQQNDDVWVGDVGQVTREEVNRVIAGGNYGWPYVEGSVTTDECAGANCQVSDYDLPVAEFGRQQGSVVIGGYVYRGTQSPSLFGQYVYANASGGNLWAISAQDTSVANQPSPAIANSIRLYAMAQGNDGEVYGLKLNPEGAAGDVIYKLSGSGGTTTNMPANLSETGCFYPVTKQSPAGVFEYEVNAPLWTDGENKRRAFAIPDNTQIDVLNDGDYQFPQGSVLVKHFLFGERYLETRLLINNSLGWEGYSYEWNEQQTEAVLLETGKEVDVEGVMHTFPSRSQCGDCHSSAANISLGVEHAQLNYHDPILDSNVIDYLSNYDYFSEPQSSTEQQALVNLNDENATVEDKARSYLHSNCSGCHRPGAAFGDIDLRYSTAFADTNLCNVLPSRGTLGVEGARRIAAGEPELSVLLLRMQTLDKQQRMPPLATSVVDTNAVEVMSEWISSMSGCN